MTVLCATGMRPMHGVGIDPLVRAASDAGATGIHVGGEMFLEQLPTVLPAVLRAGLLVPSMMLPLAPRPLARGKRLPALGGADADEREAALALATESLEAGLAAGVRWAVLDFGGVRLPVAPREIAALFARRALEAGETGADELAFARAVRKSESPRLVDACSWSVERLCRLAEARGVTLLLPVAGTPWDLPSAREALALLEALRGAPVALLWAPGVLTAARTLGLNLPEARLAAVVAAAGAALETDAVGLDPGYLPGLGERDETLPTRPRLPAGAPVVVAGLPDSTDVEIARAVARVTAVYAEEDAAPEASASS